MFPLCGLDERGAGRTVRMNGRRLVAEASLKVDESQFFETDSHCFDRHTELLRK